MVPGTSLVRAVFLLSMALKVEAYPKNFNETDGSFQFIFKDERNLLLVVHFEGCYLYDVPDNSAVESHLDNHRVSDTLRELCKQAINAGNVSLLYRDLLVANYSYITSEPACMSSNSGLGLFKQFFMLILPALAPQVLTAEAYPESFNQTHGRFSYYFYDSTNLLLVVYFNGCYLYDVPDNSAVESHLDNHRVSDTLLALIEHSLMYGINVSVLTKETIAANYSYIVADPACRSEAVGMGLLKDFFTFTLPALTPLVTSVASHTSTTTGSPTGCADHTVPGITCTPEVCALSIAASVCARTCGLCFAPVG